MTACIICREEQEFFSDEHVIPDALGGFYHIHTVCKACNSELGSSVDSKLINHQFANFQRYLLGLKGKSGEIPNPFAGTHKMTEDESIKVQLRLGKDGKPAPYVVTNVKYEDLNDKGETKISICLDVSEERKLDGILAKIAKRLQIPLEEINGVDRHAQSIDRPTVNCSMSIDLSDFKIGLLKIAYEFAVDSVPEFFSDDSAIDISKVLKCGDCDAAKGYVDMGNGFDRSLFDALSDFINLDSKKHYLVLLGSEKNGLQCLIHLHNMFSIGVTLSSKSYPEELFIVGINDLEKKNFRKLSLDDIIKEVYSSPELRFQYFFKTEQSLHEFIADQANEDFEVLKENSHIPIFDKTGNFSTTLYEKMKAVEHLAIHEAPGSGAVAHVFPLQGENYIKILPSGKLVQIMAVREERYILSRL